MIGVNGYYGASRLALQMVPTKNRTIDTPRTDIPYSVATAGAFRWLEGEWPYPVPVNSEVMVDMGVTTGGTILEVGRWEDNYWEMFSVPREKIDKSKARLVPLGVLLAFDPALVFVTNLAVGDTAPANTTYEPGTITLQGAPLTDAADADAGAFAANAVTVQLGSIAGGQTRTVTFKVRIN